MTITIAVTGATGFLGTHLCSSLVSQGCYVRAFVRNGTDALPGSVLPQPLRDLDDSVSLRMGCAGAHVVVHLAARVHLLQDTEKNPEEEYRHINVEGTRNVLEAAHGAGVSHAILLSSVKAVGESNVVPWTEDQAPAPADAYGRSKLQMEQLAREFASRSGMRISVLRLPLVYGPRVAANVYRLLRLVDHGWPLPLGGIKNRRSMIYVDNAVAAVLALVETPAAAEGVFFASDGPDLSTPELIRVIASALGRPTRLLPVPVPVLRAIGWLGDGLRAWAPFPITSAEVERLVGSLTVTSDKLSAATGFRPVITPEEGWRRTVNWYRSTRSSA